MSGKSIERYRICLTVLICLLLMACSACIGAETTILGENDMASKASTEIVAEGDVNENTGLSWDSLHVYADASIDRTRIDVQNVDGTNMLILPSYMSPSEVNFWFADADDVQIRIEGAKGNIVVRNGETVDLTMLCEAEDFTVKISSTEASENETYEVRVIFSEKIATIYLCSDDPVEYGREWVEESGHKTNKATGYMVMQNADGSIVYDGGLTQIKGRGNTIWQCVKKPYQIKTESKIDLLETDDAHNKSKTWVLLANYYDNTLLRNMLTLNTGNALGMQYNIEGRWVDLYYDAEYRGSYLLTEKVEVAEGRVDIEDLEKVNEELNADMESSSVNEGMTSNGAIFYYCEDMVSPKDITGGYLLEIDYEVRAKEEVCYFVTKQEYYVVVKSPEFATKEQMEYIATLYQAFEDAIYNGGVNPTTGKHFSEYVDMESIVKIYLISEWTRNRDAFASSTYFYKEAGNDVMTMGPLWDYDLCLGTGDGDSLLEKVSPEGVRAARKRLGEKLCIMSDFCVAVKEVYANEFRPLIQDVVLGDVNAVSEDGSLHSLEYYVQNIEASAKCNMLQWYPGQNWEDEVDYVRQFISQRIQYLDKIFDAWVPGQTVPEL